MPINYNRRRHNIKSTSASETLLFEEIIDIIGDRWSALIIRSIFTNLNNYQDIFEDTGIATNILAERLERLCQMEIIEKKAFVYKLMPKGLSIYPILLGLLEWGDKYYSISNGPPVFLEHNSCKNTLKSRMACSECGDTISMNDIEFEVLETGMRKNMATVFR